MTKTSQLQIRIAPQDKARLKRLARRAGRDVSEYVLERVFPPPADRFGEIIGALAAGGERRYVLAELHDFLADLVPAAFADALVRPPADLSPFLMNYVAAMVEHAAKGKQVPAPPWTRDVVPLEEPVFATDLPGLRMHLLWSSPIAFKRRNIFVDAAVGERV